MSLCFVVLQLEFVTFLTLMIIWPLFFRSSFVSLIFRSALSPDAVANIYGSGIHHLLNSPFAFIRLIGPLLLGTVDKRSLRRNDDDEDDDDEDQHLAAQASSYLPADAAMGLMPPPPPRQRAPVTAPSLLGGRANQLDDDDSK